MGWSLSLLTNLDAFLRKGFSTLECLNEPGLKVFCNLKASLDLQYFQIIYHKSLMYVFMSRIFRDVFLKVGLVGSWSCIESKSYIFMSAAVSLVIKFLKKGYCPSIR